MAWAQAHELRPHRCTAFAVTPGWLRSEMMLDACGVSEANWCDATAKQPHFVITETLRSVGRAIAVLAVDPERARWTGQSLSSGQLAQVYGVTDLDGSQPQASDVSFGVWTRQFGSISLALPSERGTVKRN